MLSLKKTQNESRPRLREQEARRSAREMALEKVRVL